MNMMVLIVDAIGWTARSSNRNIVVVFCWFSLFGRDDAEVCVVDAGSMGGSGELRLRECALDR